jgi:hypothetical protein
VGRSGPSVAVGSPTELVRPASVAPHRAAVVLADADVVGPAANARRLSRLARRSGAGAGARVLRSRFGEVLSPRSLYERVHGTGPATLAPQDCAVGIAAGRMTLGVHLLAGYLAARVAFDEVVDVMGRFTAYVHRTARSRHRRPARPGGHAASRRHGRARGRRRDPRHPERRRGCRDDQPSRTRPSLPAAPEGTAREGRSHRTHAEAPVPAACPPTKGEQSKNARLAVRGARGARPRASSANARSDTLDGDTVGELR